MMMLHGQCSQIDSRERSEYISNFSEWWCRRYTRHPFRDFLHNARRHEPVCILLRRDLCPNNCNTGKHLHVGGAARPGGLIDR